MEIIKSVWKVRYVSINASFSYPCLVLSAYIIEGREEGGGQFGKHPAGLQAA